MDKAQTYKDLMEITLDNNCKVAISKKASKQTEYEREEKNKTKIVEVKPKPPTQESIKAEQQRRMQESIKAEQQRRMQEQRPTVLQGKLPQLPQRMPIKLN